MNKDQATQALSLLQRLYESVPTATIDTDPYLLQSLVNQSLALLPSQFQRDWENTLKARNLQLYESVLNPDYRLELRNLISRYIRIYESVVTAPETATQDANALDREHLQILLDEYEDYQKNQAAVESSWKTFFATQVTLYNQRILYQIPDELRVGREEEIKVIVESIVETVYSQPKERRDNLSPAFMLGEVSKRLVPKIAAHAIQVDELNQELLVTDELLSNPEFQEVIMETYQETRHKYQQAPRDPATIRFFVNTAIPKARKALKNAHADKATSTVLQALYERFERNQTVVNSQGILKEATGIVADQQILQAQIEKTKNSLSRAQRILTQDINTETKLYQSLLEVTSSVQQLSVSTQIPNETNVRRAAFVGRVLAPTIVSHEKLKELDKETGPTVFQSDTQAARDLERDAIKKINAAQEKIQIKLANAQGIINIGLILPELYALRGDLENLGVKEKDLPVRLRNLIDHMRTQPDVIAAQRTQEEIDKVKELQKKLRQMDTQTVRDVVGKTLSASVTEIQMGSRPQNLQLLTKHIIEYEHAYRNTPSPEARLRLGSQYELLLGILYPTLTLGEIRQLLGTMQRMPAELLVGNYQVPLATDGAIVGYQSYLQSLSAQERQAVGVPPYFYEARRAYSTVRTAQNVIGVLRGGPVASGLNGVLRGMLGLGTRGAAISATGAAGTAATGAATTAAATTAPVWGPILAVVLGIVGIFALILVVFMIDSGTKQPSFREATGGAGPGAGGGGLYSGPTVTAGVLGCPTNPAGLSQCPFESGQTHANLNAYDITPGMEAPVFATHDGIVTSFVDSFGRNWSDGCNAIRGYGNHVVLQSTDGSYSTLYGHLLDVTPAVASSLKSHTIITAGTQIGRVDNNGCTYGSKSPSEGGGTHLHYEWRDASGRSPHTSQPVLDTVKCGYTGLGQCLQ